jgi:hypothetical protein
MWGSDTAESIEAIYTRISARPGAAAIIGHVEGFPERAALHLNECDVSGRIS